MNNIDYKTDILEYLEGNNSNSQTDIDIIETHLEDEKIDWKNDVYNISNMSPNSNSPVDMDKKIGIQERSQDEILRSEITGNFSESQYSKNSRSKKGKCRTASTLSSQSNESPTHSAGPSTSKNNSSKKKNIRRRRALSSASKVSIISQSESPVPYSWSFSGQDFRTLHDDLKTTYFSPLLGAHQPYFAISQPQVKETTNDSLTLEVPSWRIKICLPEESVLATENMDEELYLKRHLKMEAEEKRRKRWDFQMIREQRHIEKLKQRQERRNSSGIKQGRNAKVVCSTSGEELPSSLYPSPEDVVAIEITDSLPVTAFGECIPDLPIRSFQLPWIRCRSHSHLMLKKKPKISRSDDDVTC